MYLVFAKEKDEEKERKNCERTRQVSDDSLTFRFRAINSFSIRSSSSFRVGVGKGSDSATYLCTIKIDCK